MATGTLTTNTTSAEYTNSKPAIHCAGTWGGGTVSVQVEDDNGTFRTLSEGTFTSDFSIVLDFRRSVTIRLSLAGATNPSLVYVFK